MGSNLGNKMMAGQYYVLNNTELHDHNASSAPFYLSILGKQKEQKAFA